MALAAAPGAAYALDHGDGEHPPLEAAGEATAPATSGDSTPPASTPPPESPSSSPTPPPESPPAPQQSPTRHGDISQPGPTHDSHLEGPAPDAPDQAPTRPAETPRPEAAPSVTPQPAPPRDEPPATVATPAPTTHAEEPAPPPAETMAAPAETVAAPAAVEGHARTAVGAPVEDSPIAPGRAAEASAVGEGHAVAAPPETATPQGRGPDAVVAVAPAPDGPAAGTLTPAEASPTPAPSAADEPSAADGASTLETGSSSPSMSTGTHRSRPAGPVDPTDPTSPPVFVTPPAPPRPSSPTLALPWSARPLWLTRPGVDVDDEPTPYPAPSLSGTRRDRDASTGGAVDDDTPAAATPRRPARPASRLRVRPHSSRPATPHRSTDSTERPAPSTAPDRPAAPGPEGEEARPPRPRPARTSAPAPRPTPAPPRPAPVEDEPEAAHPSPTGTDPAPDAPSTPSTPSTPGPTAPQPTAPGPTPTRPTPAPTTTHRTPPAGPPPTRSAPERAPERPDVTLAPPGGSRRPSHERPLAGPEHASAPRAVPHLPEPRGPEYAAVPTYPEAPTGESAAPTWASGYHLGDASAPARDLARRVERERGRTYGALGARLRMSAWADLRADAPAIKALAGSTAKRVLSLPLVPENGGDLAACGRGAYRPHWKTFGDAVRRSGLRGVVFDLGDGAAATTPTPAAYAACFRDVAATLRASDPRSTIQWTAVAGVAPRGGSDAEAAWPGEKFVDLLGVTAFGGDRSWARVLTGRHGLNWWSDFGSERGIRLAVAEWGPPDTSVERATNAAFVQNLRGWMVRLARKGNLAYDLYTEPEGAAAGPGGAAYRKLF